MSTFTLLIIYKDGEKKTIEGVGKYGVSTESEKLLFFIKNGYASFTPISEVRYFGREFDYERK